MMLSVVPWMVGAISSRFLGTSPLATQSLKHFSSCLSAGAEVYYPGSEEFANATLRWGAAQIPQYNMVVKVATEHDVQETILYANSKKKPFLAISGTHGTNTALNNVKNGVGILMRGMDNITIVDEGHAALIEGGILNGDLMSYLWAHGKQTMTTGCDCVGYISPILGGGHGWFQGRYGLASDQLISARLVLANGTAMTVCEETNSDLFWALRGAGHNFGIVTQAKIKIYDRQPDLDQWSVAGFVFTHDKMEAVMTIANTWLQSTDRPVPMTHYGIFSFNPEVDNVNPIVLMRIYHNSPAIPTEYTDPLYTLSPVSVEQSIVSIVDMNKYTEANRDGAACAKGLTRAILPVSAHTYNLPALRKVLDIFTAMPLEFRNSVFFLEAYATNKVVEIPSNSTAYPDRDGQLLLAPLLNYAPNTSLDNLAWKINSQIRDALIEGTGEMLEAYVNYARGDESTEEVYGYEPWRLEKLRRLKKVYDPYGRFNFFAPIV